MAFISSRGTFGQIIYILYIIFIYKSVPDNSFIIRKQEVLASMNMQILKARNRETRLILLPTAGSHHYLFDTFDPNHSNVGLFVTKFDGYLEQQVVEAGNI